MLFVKPMASRRTKRVNPQGSTSLKLFEENEPRCKPVHTSSDTNSVRSSYVESNNNNNNNPK